jgi:hypothetical protein
MPDESGGLEVSLRAALDQAGPELRAVVVSALAGLAASLRAGARLAGQADPAAGLCEELARTLDDFPETEAPPRAAEPRVVPAGPAVPQLGGLAREFAADPAVTRFLGVSPRLGDADAEIWRRLWLACLRLPAAEAARWREQAARACDAARAEGDAGAWRELPAAAGERVLVAATPGVRGLRETPGEPVDADVAAAMSTAGEHRFAALAVVATQVLRMAEEDPEVCHCLEAMKVDGLQPLAAAPVRAEYRDHLLIRLRQLSKAGDPESALRALWRVDEALCSVVHFPPAAPDSWWGGLTVRSRRVLKDTAWQLQERSADVDVKVPDRQGYQEVEDLTGPRDIGLRVPSGQIGQVLAWVRTYLRVGSVVEPGRVIFVRE